MATIRYKAPGQAKFGPAKITTTAGTSQSFDLGGVSEFWILSAGDIFVAWTNDTSTPTLTAANAALLGAGLYGPFEKPSQFRYIKVAGNGGTPAVTLTVA